MFVKNCKICGKQFNAIQSNYKTCSKGCKKKNEDILNANYVKRKRKNNSEFLKKEKAYKQTEGYKKQSRVYAKTRRQLKLDWASNHPKQKKEYDKDYYQNNKENARIRGREYHKLHPEYAKMSKARRRTKFKKAGSLPHISIVKHRLELFKGCCYCDCQSKLTLEHLIPISKGGTNHPSNLYGSCLKCKTSKQDREWKNWYRKQRYYKPERELEIIYFQNNEVIIVENNKAV